GLVPAELGCLAVGPEPGLVEDLVGVDVAETGEDGVVHEQRLERATALGQAVAEDVELEAVLERIGTEVLDALGGARVARDLDQPELALADVDEAEGVLVAQDQARVRGQ